MQETWVQSPVQEDPLGKEMATHPSTLTWEIPWTEGPGGLQSTGLQRVDMTEQLNKNSRMVVKSSTQKILPKPSFF